MNINDVHPNDGVRRVVKSAAIFQQLGVQKTLDWLQTHGISGDPGASTRCVLAEYFKYISGGQKIAVADRIQVGDFSFQCPKVLSYIWREFDQGRYPKLIRPDDKNAQQMIDELMQTIKVEETPIPAEGLTDSR